MATETTLLELLEGVTPEEMPRRRFTIEEYYRMAEAGILDEDDRVELIEGEILMMTPIGHVHSGTVNTLVREFSSLFADVALISPQNPVRLSEGNEPQPDLALLRLREDNYRSGHPTPQDVYLIIEVAQTSRERDTRIKVPLYARHGIGEVWVVDLHGQGIVAFRDPSPGGYRTIKSFGRGERLAPVAFPDREIQVDRILG